MSNSVLDWGEVSSITSIVLHLLYDSIEKVIEKLVSVLVLACTK